MFALAPFAILFPLLGLGINLLLPRRGQSAGYIASAAASLAFGVAVSQFIALLHQPAGAVITLAEWIHVGSLQLNWTLQLDTLSVTMMLMVTGVGTLIHVYALEYMRGDERFARFFVYLNLFLAAMLVLVLGANYAVVFVGWELVGACSYLLIGFWFENAPNATAGRKAFIVNRVGDAGLLLALSLIFWTFGSLDFKAVFARAAGITHELPLITFIVLGLLVGVAGKSAQLPLSIWLPDAMAGPTPVSALIHAATMVTAGIYLLVRSGPLLALSPSAQSVVAWVGALTAVWAALSAIGQCDIKRVLAYSTISQLGFMVAAVGVGAPVAAMFHLVTHAFFKALLFLAAGAVIQGLEADGHHAHGLQDMRKMGGLRKTMPLTFAAFTVGALALTGLPPLAGFFSKDEILVSAWAHNLWVYGLLTVATACTAFYTGRQLGWVFFGQPRSAEARHATERPLALLWPLGVLVTLSIIGGALNWPGQLALSGWLNHTLPETAHSEFNWPIAAISVTLTVLGLGLGARVYGRTTVGEADPLARGLSVFQHAFWVDEVCAWAIQQPYRGMSQWLADTDRAVLTGLEQSLIRALDGLAAGARRLQTGQLNWNMFGLVLGLMMTLLMVLWGELR